MKKSHALLFTKKWLLMAASVYAIFFMCGCKKNNTYSTPGEQIANIYVANEDGQSISVIDSKSMTKVTDVDVSDTSISMVMPHNVQVAPNGKTVWATAMGMDTSEYDQVIVINPLSNQVIKRVYLGKDLHLAHVVLDKLCDNAFVSAYEGNKIFQINTTSYAVVHVYNLDSLSGPHGMRYSNGKLYVANMDGNSMAIIDVATKITTYVPLGGIAVQAAVTTNDKYAFVSLYDTREIVRYNIQTQQLTKISLPAGALGPVQIYPTPDSKYLYVCDQGGLLGQAISNKVYVIDIENASVIKTIIAGAKTHGVIINNTGTHAFVTNMDDNTITKINITTNTVEGTASTGLAPNGIGFWYGSGGMP